MTSKWNVLSQPEQLGLTTRECIDSLPFLVQFLKDNPNPLGQVLLGAEDKPWTKRDVAVFETSVMERVDEKRIVDFLATARSAAHFWSVRKQTIVPLPHYYFKPHSKDDCPLDEDYAEAVAPYQAWRKQLSGWIHELNAPTSTPYADRPRLLASLICSAMLHGGAIGDRFIAAIVRAIEQKQERTFAIGGRIHIELYLSWYGVEDAETRLWLPDVLTATLWTCVEPQDVKSLLDSVQTKRGTRPPNDEEIVNRLRKLIEEAACGSPSEQKLGGFAALQRSCRIVAHIHLRPVLAHYCDCEISSNSVKRQHLRRLFPKGELVQFRSTANPSAGRVQASPTPAPVPAAAGPVWLNDLLLAARSKFARGALEEFAKAKRRDALARRLADFGVSLLSSSLYSGKTLRPRDLPEVLERLAISLGPFSTGKDIAKIGASDALDLYTRAIKAQPVRARRSLIKWILEFDLFLRARVKRRDPVPKSKLPWPPPDISAVDVNLATHEEYSELLRRIDRLWDVRDSERRKRMMRLIVILSFRCGLRRNEIRNLRLAGVLIRGGAELLIWPRKGEPRKSGRARRRVPIAALLSPDELKEFQRWFDERVHEDCARPEDRLFALTKKLKWIPNSLFDKLNAFLRAQSRWDCDGEEGGIHIHTLRHAFGGEIFVSLMVAEMEEPITLFPDLWETNAWLRRGKRIGQALFGRTQPTGKQPAFTAHLAAHADFHTTAHSYIHLFPWLTAALLEAGDATTPDDDLVKLACRSKPGTLRDWVTAGGIHNVPVQLMKRSGANILIESEPKGGREVLPSPASSCTSWVEKEWDSLMRLCAKSPKGSVDPSKPAVVNRAEYLLSLTTSDKKPRHRMEMWTPDRADQVNRFRITCPAKPPHERNAVSAELCSQIVKLHKENPDLVRDAADIFVHHLEQRDWVRFGSTKELANANRYIGFLCALKLGPHKIGLVSGATEKESHLKKEWKSKLAQPNLVIRPAGKSRNFGPKTSLSIRPIAGEKGGTAIGHAGFRFMMMMAYIAFGTEPAGQTKAGPTL